MRANIFFIYNMYFTMTKIYIKKQFHNASLKIICYL